MIRKLPTVALLIGALAIAGQAQAHGGGGNYWQGPAVFGAIVGSAIVGSALINANRPVYVQQPVYVQPAPVYYGPPRGYYGRPHGYYGGPHGYYGGPRW